MKSGSMKDPVSLNPAFPRADSAVIGQIARSVVIGVLLTLHVGNETPVTISKFQLQRLPLFTQ